MREKESCADFYPTVLADNGSRWFCAAAHVVGSSSFEMQTCGDSGVRYWIGVATVFAMLVLGIISLWRIGERHAR